MGRVSVPLWPINLSVRLLIVALVGRYLTNKLIRRGLLPHRISPLIASRCRVTILCGISTGFPVLSPCKGQIAHALLTRPPLNFRSFRPKTSVSKVPLDLHVLGTPPAFVLSQDQTLRLIIQASFLLLYHLRLFALSGIKTSIVLLSGFFVFFSNFLTSYMFVSVHFFELHTLFTFPGSSSFCAAVLSDSSTMISF